MKPKPLYWKMATAAADNNVAEVKKYLAKGYDINAKNKRGETAFSYACASNALDVAKYLHSEGANINTIDVDNGSSLDWAVEWSSQEFCDWLVSVGGKRNDI